ncbi:MAG: helix-turn-helix domain-containing protein, partial [Pseudomonadota bacterium]|nr:helix-turn-helix domain-containing protein [Pseudomonadota bacterium]
MFKSMGANNMGAKLAYTVPEALSILPIGRTTFYRLARDGKIDLRKIGYRTVVTAESLDRLI